MAQNRNKAWETDDGIIIDEAVFISSGTSAPTHSANSGDIFFQTDGTKWINTSSPSPGTTWTLQSLGVDTDRILLNQNFDILADQNGNLLLKE